MAGPVKDNNHDAKSLEEVAAWMLPGFGTELITDIEKKFPYLPGAFDKPNPDFAA